MQFLQVVLEGESLVKVFFCLELFPLLYLAQVTQQVPFVLRCIYVLQTVQFLAILILVDNLRNGFVQFFKTDGILEFFNLVVVIYDVGSIGCLQLANVPLLVPLGVPDEELIGLLASLDDVGEELLGDGEDDGLVGGTVGCVLSKGGVDVVVAIYDLALGEEGQLQHLFPFAEGPLVGHQGLFLLLTFLPTQSYLPRPYHTQLLYYFALFEETLFPGQLSLPTVLTKHLQLVRR